MANSTKIIFVLPQWLKDEVDKAAENLGVNTSEYIRDVLKEAVKKQAEKEQKIS